MQFIVTGYDGNDDKALERRMNAREAHLNMVDEMIEKGHDLYAAALLDESGNMKGSMMVVEFASRALHNKQRMAKSRNSRMQGCCCIC